MSDVEARPPWYGTKRGGAHNRAGRKLESRAPKPVTPGDGRQLNGQLAPGCTTKPGPGAPVGHPGWSKPGIETLIERERSKIKRTLKQIIDDDFPDARERAIAVLVEIMEDKEREAPARIAAVRELLNRRDGKPVERKQVKRVGDSGPNINVQMFGDMAWLDTEIKDPQARYAIAARIHEQQQQQLEHTTVIEVEANGQTDGTEAEARPGPDVSNADGLSG